MASRIIKAKPIPLGKPKSTKGIMKTERRLNIPTKKVYDFGLDGPAKTILSPKDAKAKHKYEKIIAVSQNIFVFLL
jgi:hypothetical protein